MSNSVHSSALWNPVPQVWVRSNLDAMLVFQAALDGHIGIWRTRPTRAEREAAIYHGSVLVWDETDSKTTRWTDHIAWSESRQLQGFMIYREPCGTHEPSPDYSTHETNDRELYKDIFSSFRTHSQFRKDGYMKRTICITVDDHKLRLINYYRPEALLPTSTTGLARLPEVTSLPQFAHKLYDLHPDLFTVRREAPLLNILSVSRIRSQRVKVYAGEHRATLKQLVYHQKKAVEYWARQWGVDEDDIQITAPDGGVSKLAYDDDDNQVFEASFLIPNPQSLKKQRLMSAASAASSLSSRSVRDQRRGAIASVEDLLAPSTSRSSVHALPNPMPNVRHRPYPSSRPSSLRGYPSSANAEASRSQYRSPMGRTIQHPILHPSMESFYSLSHPPETFQQQQQIPDFHGQYYPAYQPIHSSFLSLHNTSQSPPLQHLDPTHHHDTHYHTFDWNPPPTNSQQEP